MRMENGVVTDFAEKPQVSVGYINGGFFVLDIRRIWKYLGADPQTTLEREPLQQLAADGQLMAYEHTDFFQPMDTAREYRRYRTSNASPSRCWATRSSRSSSLRRA